MIKLSEKTNKITVYFTNRSLRWKIMICFILSIVFISTSLLVFLRLNNYSMELIGNSYKSNAELNLLSKQLADSEKAMETYFKYRTFESIDAYFFYQSKSEIYINEMQSKPSTDIILQKEYTVFQLSESYLFYSGKAIASRRANNSPEQDIYYAKALECYNLLTGQLSALNILLLENNAQIYNENRDSINRITSGSLFFIIIFFILILIFLYISITSITHPLAEISEVANRLSERDFDVPLFNKNTHNEIGNICRAFDRMIISIREYIDTIWEKALAETKLKEKEIEMQALYADAQIRALQSQINPHFLFNTLNTGAQLAMMEGADKTCYFIEQVADFFRYNIQQQDQNASINEELSLVDNFVYIMKVRFGSRLEFIKQIPDYPLTEQLPSMTLQPLVENCIKHGLKNSKGKVTLHVDDEVNFLTISITDNGSGMPLEIKNQVIKAVFSGNTQQINFSETSKYTDEKTKNTGTGLINVFSRLRLYFHRDDVFDIQNSSQETGTKFIIRIPKNV